MGWNCCKGNSYPGDLGVGTRESTVFFRLGGWVVCVVFIYFLEERGEGVSVQLTLPGEVASPGAAAPGVWLSSGWEQMAPDPRVPAAAAAPRERPASVRRGGWTRRAEGASFPLPPPPTLSLPRPVASLGLGSGARFPIALWRVLREGREGRIEKSNLHSLGCGGQA